MNSDPSRVGIIQSCYIPWKGYFDFIDSVDVFVLFDDVQYTRRDWRNRNRIKTPEGLMWLTVPVEVKGRYCQRIRDTRVADRTWTERHWRSISHNYARAPYFGEFAEVFERLYKRAGQLEFLSEINYLFIVEICQLLWITTPIRLSSEFDLVDGRSERLLEICCQANAREYVSGPAAAGYLDRRLFESSGVDVSFFDYGGYVEYQQLHPPFEHGVTVLDLLFNTGRSARSFLKRAKPEPT